jgi:hypothetical protein
MNIEINKILPYNINFNFITRLIPFVSVITKCLNFVTFEKKVANNSSIMTLPCITATKNTIYLAYLYLISRRPSYYLLQLTFVSLWFLLFSVIKRKKLAATEASLFRSSKLNLEMSRYLLLQ